MHKFTSNTKIIKSSTTDIHLNIENEFFEYINCIQSTNVMHAELTIKNMLIKTHYNTVVCTEKYD